MSPTTPSALFDESYFKSGCGPIPYERRSEWLDRFSMIADRIVRDIGPRSALDAGCAMGFLVEALRDRGVEAYGVDISEYAIGQVREDIKPYCWVGSLTDPLPRRYNLIVCIEVLEHLTKPEGELAIEQLCKASDYILLSTSPDDYRESTHFNVQSPDYWVELFAQQGFLRDVDFDASFITDWAILVRRTTEPAHRSIAAYERKLWRLSKEVTSLREVIQEMRDSGGSGQALATQIADKEHEIQALAARVADQEREEQRLEWELAAIAWDHRNLVEQLRAIEQRLSWQLLQRAWQAQMRFAPPGSWQGRVWLSGIRLARAVLRPILSRALRAGSAYGFRANRMPDEDAYADWLCRCEAVRFNPELAARRIERLGYQPVVSIVMPVYNTPIEWLRKAIDSVRGQYYPHWELCICDDASPAPHIREILEEYAAEDDRIKVAFAPENGGIAAASSRALDLATGDFVGLLDHDDELTPDALYEVATALQNVDADLVYSDEDKLDESGRPFDPFFKPAWSPDLLLSCMYTGHFSVYRRSLIDRIGGFRTECDGSQDYDLVLRATEQPCKVLHIPKVLYHWRQIAGSAALTPGAKPYAYEAAQRALAEALSRRGIAGTVESEPAFGYYRVRRAITRPGKVSIIIPMRESVASLRNCIASIEAKTRDADYEILIAHSDSEDTATLAYLRDTPHRVLRVAGPFNYSRLNNRAAEAASGEYLLLLNDDTEVISPGWLSAMIEHAQRPEIGAVGAKLLSPDGRIRHAGVILGRGGVADSAQKSVHGYTGFGYFNFPNVARNCSAVSGACLMIRRELYNAIGGLNETVLPASFNDVDLCLRLRQQGFLNVYTPHALLRHHEPTTPGGEVDPDEEAYMLATWRRHLENDPYYNPNLTLTGTAFALDVAKLDSLYCIHAQKSAARTVGPLGPGKVIGQEFTASEDSLCAISVRFSTGRRRRAGTVRLRLRDSSRAADDLRVVDVDAATIVDNHYHLFVFNPLDDSAGRRFSFSVELLDQPMGSSLSVWRSASIDPTAGPYLDGRQPQQGTLSFDAHCLKHVFRYAESHGPAPTAQSPPARL